jgi:hypothetical protein
MTVDGFSGLSANDRALVAEAIRRVQTARGGASSDPSIVAQAVSTALMQGRRDLFGLVKAGRSAV